MRTAAGICLILVVSLVQAQEKLLPPTEYVKTVGELLDPKEKGQNYRLKVKDEVYLLGFDDKYERWPEIKKELPKLVGKQVEVRHRKGFIEFGKVKVLLCRDIKEYAP